MKNYEETKRELLRNPSIKQWVKDVFAIIDTKEPIYVLHVLEMLSSFTEKRLKKDGKND